MPTVLHLPRTFVVVLVAAAFVLFGTSVAFALDNSLGGKVRSGQDVVIPAGQTVEGNLYVSGGTVRVEGTVTGDLVAAGGQVEVSGEVKNDLLAAGGTIDVSGRVEGDARLAGGRVTVSGPIGQDLVLGAGQATVTSSARVGQDLVFGAGQMTLDGRVTGSVLGTTPNYSKHGAVGGTENVTIAEQDEKAEPTVASRLVDGLQRWIGILAVAALALWLLPGILRGTADSVHRRPLPSLGFGVLGIIGLVVFVVAVLIGAVLSAVVFGLLGLGDLVALALFGALTLLVIAGFAFFVVVTFLAPAAVGLALGALALGDEPRSRRWLGLALGLLVVVILTSLPVVGGWLGLLVVLLGLGAAVRLSWSRRRRPPAQAAAEPAAT
ncbi:MAG: polymer-forming cytoskeletal protein [Nocardioidaceae bacterium]